MWSEFDQWKNILDDEHLKFFLGRLAHFYNTEDIIEISISIYTLRHIYIYTKHCNYLNN